MPFFSRSIDEVLAPQVLRALPVGIAVYKLEKPGDPASLRLVYANEASEAITGLKSSKEVGRFMREITPEVMDTDVPAAYTRVAMSGKAENLGTVTYGDDRIQRSTFHLRAIPLEDRMVAVVFEDVSDSADLAELRKAQDSLVSKERRYRSLVEATAAIVWQTPPSGEFESDQPHWRAFTGQSEEELMGWGWLGAIHPDDNQKTADAWNAAVAARDTYNVVHRLRRHDGEYRHMLARAVPVLDASGEILEWVGVHTDVHDQTLASDALEASESRFRTLFDAFGDVVLVYPVREDGPGELLAFNRAAVQRYGYTEEELHDLTIQDLIKPGSLSVPDAIARLRRETQATFDSVHLTKEGQRLHMSTNARLVEYDGELCILAICRDDTERRAFQRQLSRANLRLERTVNERTAEIEAFADDLRILHRIITEEHASPEARFDAFLRAGCEMFDLPLGILSSTPKDPETGEALYRLEAVVSPDPSIEAGLTIPLSEAFCDAVYETGETVVYGDAADEAPSHPACVQRGLRAFIGTPIRVDGEFFGTLNFVSPEAREDGFKTTELDLIEMMAGAIGRQISLDRVTQKNARDLAWHRAVAEAVNDAVVHIDAEGHVLEHNEAAEDVLEGDHLPLQRVDRYGAPLAPEAFPERVAMLDERTVRSRLQGLGDEEMRQWYLVNASPVDEDHDGMLDGAVVVLQDVTAVQQIAERAMRSRDLLRSVLAASPEGVMAFRAIREDGEIVDFEWILANPRVETIIGRSEADLIGNRLLEVFPGNREAGLFDAYVDVVESQEPYETVIPYNHDGLNTSFRLVAVPIPSEDGFTVTFVEVIDVVDLDDTLPAEDT
ncbi:PAS domain S-box protein [Rubricoccus marinus]|uniref:histidine kinase n=1 Tax=Rubricoccus marinus TaxID=716817 RepID=A0A259TZC5_9BACT|nr:PAS domain S-box protein [Rubricoccus marinus]OZC03071.1 hypothetical protein BSZ36_08865 [Rubricoccus marinus]